MRDDRAAVPRWSGYYAPETCPRCAHRLYEYCDFGVDYKSPPFNASMDEGVVGPNNVVQPTAFRAAAQPLAWARRAFRRPSLEAA